MNHNCYECVNESELFIKQLLNRFKLFIQTKYFLLIQKKLALAAPVMKRLLPKNHITVWWSHRSKWSWIVRKKFKKFELRLENNDAVGFYHPYHHLLSHHWYKRLLLIPTAFAPINSWLKINSSSTFILHFRIFEFLHRNGYSLKH